MISFSVKEVLQEAEKEKAKNTPIPLIEVINTGTSFDAEEEHRQESTSITPGGPATSKDEILETLEQELATIFRKRGQLSSSIYQSVYGKSSHFKIDIRAVLAKIDQLTDDRTNQSRTFGIRFLTTKGISELIDCRKQVAETRSKAGGEFPSKGKMNYNRKRNGIILLEAPGKPYRSVLVSTIFEFKDFLDTRWIRVRH